MGIRSVSQKYIISVVMNDEIKVTYLLFSVNLSVLCTCSWSRDLSSVRFPASKKYFLTDDKSFKMAPNHNTEQTSSRQTRGMSNLFHHS